MSQPSEGRKQPPRLSPRRRNSLPSSPPAIGAAGPRSGPAAPPWCVSCSRQGRRAGSGSRAGKFLCIESFYSIKISGSYNATSPLYCPGGFWGAGRHRPPADLPPPPACKGSLPPYWVHPGRNPLPRLLRNSPWGLLCARPPALPALCCGSRLFEELFIDTEMSVFFPVDKTFSCGPLKK